jgi:hypothetical protein
VVASWDYHRGAKIRGSVRGNPGRFKMSFKYYILFMHYVNYFIYFNLFYFSPNINTFI